MVNDFAESSWMDYEKKNFQLNWAALHLAESCCRLHQQIFIFFIYKTGQPSCQLCACPCSHCWQLASARLWKVPPTVTTLGIKKRYSKSGVCNRLFVSSSVWACLHPPHSPFDPISSLLICEWFFKFLWFVDRNALQIKNILKNLYIDRVLRKITKALYLKIIQFDRMWVRETAWLKFWLESLWAKDQAAVHLLPFKLLPKSG